jgi:stearoyl-CoA desaturase (delta-9 desaturase)
MLVSEPWALVTLVCATPVLALLICQLAMETTTVYLHRYLAHGGIELRPEVRAIARIVIWTTTALKPRQWASVHRRHHATVDTAEDPHSPLNFGSARSGAWYVLWRNAPLYTAATRDERLATKYRDLTADRWDRWFFDHGEAGLVLGIGLACVAMASLGRLLVGGWIGILVGFAVGLAASMLHAMLYVFAGGAINGFGHAEATKRPNGGHARNMPILAWLTVGEGWHRNHHAAENSPRLGYGHQLDLGWLTICALRHLRLARITTRGNAGISRLQTLNAAATSGPAVTQSR